MFLGLKRKLRRQEQAIVGEEKWLELARAARWREAAAAFDASNPIATPEETVLLGHCRKESGDLIGALEEYSKAAKNGPKNIEAIHFRGHLLNLLGRLDEAEEDLRVSAKSALYLSDTLLLQNLAESRLVNPEIKSYVDKLGRCVRYIDLTSRPRSVILPTPKFDSPMHRQAEALFDRQWYLKKYADVAASGSDPFEHFMQHGYAELRDPNPFFWTGWYTRRHPELLRQGINPLLYYAVFGWQQNHMVSPIFDPLFYTDNYLSDNSSMVDPLLHFLQSEEPQFADIMPLFSSAWHVENNGRTGVEHALVSAVSDVHDLRPVNRFFDPKIYYSLNPDVRRSKVPALRHFLEWGLEEGRSFNQKIDFGFARMYSGVDRYSDYDMIVEYIWGTSLSETPYTVKDITPYSAKASASTVVVGSKCAFGIVIWDEDTDQINRAIRSIAQSCRRTGLVSDFQVTIFNNGRTVNVSEIAGATIIDRGLNQGFAVGQSELMEYSFSNGADFYFGVNPDGRLHPNCVEELLRCWRSMGPNAILEASQFPSEHAKHFKPDTLETEWISCACFLVPKSFWVETTGFDRNIYLYCDDVDLSWTARKAGYKTLHCPTALFYHDVTMRRDLDWRYREMLITGRYMGQKWGNEHFKSWCEQELIRCGAVDAPERLPPLDDIETVEGAAEVANFKYRFSFSPVRW